MVALRAFFCKPVRREAGWQVSCCAGTLASEVVLCILSKFMAQGFRPALPCSLEKEDTTAMCCPGIARARLLRKASELSRNASKQMMCSSPGMPL